MKILENNNGVEYICPYCKSKLFIQSQDICAFEDFHSPIIRAECAACTATLYVENEIPKSWVMAACIKAGIE